MTVDLSLGLVSFASGLVGALVFYVAVIAGRFARIEAHTEGLMLFRTNVERRLIDLCIDADTPELDKLLLRFRRGDPLTEEEWVHLHDLIEHEHVEAMRDPHPLKDDSTRKVLMAVLLAAVEARHDEAKENQRRGLWNTLKKVFLGVSRLKNLFLL